MNMEVMASLASWVIYRDILVGQHIVAGSHLLGPFQWPWLHSWPGYVAVIVDKY